MLGTYYLIELQKFNRPTMRPAESCSILDLITDLGNWLNATNAGCCMETSLRGQWDYQEPSGEHPRNLSSRSSGADISTNCLRGRIKNTSTTREPIFWAVRSVYTHQLRLSARSPSTSIEGMYFRVKWVDIQAAGVSMVDALAQILRR